MHGIVIRIALLAALTLGVLAGCAEERTPPLYVRARPQTPEGQVWEVRWDGEWRPVSVDGISAPVYLTRPILEAENNFVFAGYVDTTRADSLGFELRAWNLYPPIERIPDPSAPPDTMDNMPIMIRKDFETLARYQTWSYVAASTYWPPLSQIDSSPKGFRTGMFK